jgi:hypothetical protein
MFFRRRETGPSNRVIFTPEVVAAADDLMMQMLQGPKVQALQLGDNATADVINALRDEALRLYQLREDQRGLMGRFRLRRNPLERLPLLLHAIPMDENGSAPSKTGWTVSGVSVDEHQGVKKTDEPKWETSILKEREEIDFGYGNSGYGRKKPGIRLMDSVIVTTSGVALPLFVIDLGRGNYQGFIGNSLEGVYRFAYLKAVHDKDKETLVDITRLNNTTETTFHLRRAEIYNLPTTSDS